MHTNPRTAEPLPPPPATFHFIGIGGIGMSGLARILTMWGYKVTGSDAMESAQTQSLRAIGIPVVIGHDDPSFASLADIVVTNKRAAANAATELDVGDVIAGHEHAASLGVGQGERGVRADGVVDELLDVVLAQVHLDHELSGSVLDTDLDLHQRSSFVVWWWVRGARNLTVPWGSR